MDDFKSETRRQIEERKGEILALKAKRQELRLAAATTAGAVGFRYIAATNTYVRLVSTMVDDLVLPDVVERPEPLPPDQAPPTAVQDPKKAAISAQSGSAARIVAQVFFWLLFAVPGAFIGIGLVTIAGFSWRNDPWAFWAGAVLGLSVILGMKVLASQLWKFVGHAEALREPLAARIIVAALVTVGVIVLDANLGATALTQYIKLRTFDPAQIPPFSQLFLVSLAVAGVLVLASSAVDYGHARKEPSAEERERARIEREEAKLEAARLAAEEEAKRERKEHKDALKKRIEDSYTDQVEAASKKHDARTELEKQLGEDWQLLKNNAEFKCLQGLIGQIDALSVEIAEREKDLTNYKISRGFERASEFPNGRASEGSGGSEEPQPEGQEAGSGDREEDDDDSGNAPTLA
jgi:hypothetical protein